MSIHFSEIDQNSRNSLKNLPKQGFVQAILMSGRRHKKLIEFSNSIFLRFYFKAYWRWTCIQNKLGLLGFFYLRYLFVHQIQKGQIFFRGFTPWTPTRVPSWARCEAYSTSKPTCILPHSKTQSLLKTDISKATWIIAC